MAADQSPTVPPAGLDAELAEAYVACADRNVLAALNPKVFFGYFSVCADPTQGHGSDTTYPGLDWGQSAEALLWLGRKAEVLASWDYVKGFLREDGLIPFAINPGLAGQTVYCELAAFKQKFPLVIEPNGGIYRHWFPGNPLFVLANTTFLQMAEAIFRHTGDRAWLAAQLPVLRPAAAWLMRQVNADGMVPGGAFYLERPSRLDFDGVAQCYVAHALRQAARLLNDPECAAAAERMTTAFRARFWSGDRCVEYIHPQHGAIARHGFTDVDWAAIATDMLTAEQVAVLWPELRSQPDFVYEGIPTGIATRPETYEDWEMQMLDRHDLAAMGRVWYLEAWARWRMGDQAGLLESMRRVAKVGRANGWSWHERYYSERTGSLASYKINTYCEYPANFIRIVHRFLPGGAGA